MSCLSKRLCSLLKKIICCGSETDVDAKCDVNCKVECCSTNNIKDNHTETTTIETPRNSRTNTPTPNNSRITHIARSIQNSPLLISQSRELKIDTPISGHRRLNLLNN
jgi:hypothetical protein